MKLRLKFPEAAKKETAHFPFFITSLLLMLSWSLFSTDFAGAEVNASATYRLAGTVRGPAFAGAVIVVDATGTQLFYRLYDLLPDGSQIVSVREKSIALKGTDGTLYDMYISHDRTAASASPPPVIINSPAPGAELSKPGVKRPSPRARLHRRYTPATDDE